MVRDLIFLGLALSGFSGGVGFILGSEVRPEPTELQAAQMLTGSDDVRLIGFLCDDRDATVLAQWEDEFPERGCREIRVLSAERS